MHTAQALKHGRSGLKKVSEVEGTSGSVDSEDEYCESDYPSKSNLQIYSV